MKAYPDTFADDCFEVSKKMFHCNDSEEFKDFKNRDDEMRAKLKAMNDGKPQKRARENLVKVVAWEQSHQGDITPDPKAVGAVDFGDEIRVDVRTLLEKLGYKEGKYGQWTCAAADGCQTAEVWIKRDDELLSFYTIGYEGGLRDSQDLTCKRNSGIMRLVSSVDFHEEGSPAADGFVLYYRVDGNIHKTDIDVKVWEDERSQREQEEGKSKKEENDKDPGGKVEKVEKKEEEKDKKKEDEKKEKKEEEKEPSTSEAEKRPESI